MHLCSAVHERYELIWGMMKQIKVVVSLTCFPNKQQCQRSRKTQEHELQLYAMNRLYEMRNMSIDHDKVFYQANDKVFYQENNLPAMFDP